MSKEEKMKYTLKTQERDSTWGTVEANSIFSDIDREQRIVHIDIGKQMTYINCIL